ncbi:hypothetical protein [Flavobacterium hungaricum]|uniref:Lipoprotein n=1 Tax=Flavobacterium hungaricum TaxID=2082725 RepID=A0ABR9TDF3_9FLAO|nr:hypothetical protein [Flavobacterium hungaricum]MBE8723359.1 hypothetical protein [Flavobacterium hungaricum]
MKYRIFFLLLLTLLSCKNNDDEIGRPDPYILTENHISEDCSAFQMRFDKGDYILNFALSGTCPKLKPEEYTKEYSRYLKVYNDSLPLRKGFILVQYYGFNSNIKTFQDSIIQITKRNFKTNVSLVEENNDFFMIQVGNDKAMLTRYLNKVYE